MNENITAADEQVTLGDRYYNGDGVEQDFLQFNSGIEAKISVASKKGYLVV